MLDSPEQHGPLLADTLAKIDREATRAGQVVHRLREFFRGGGLRLETLSAAELIEEGLAPARRRAERAGITVTVELHGDLPLFMADRVQMGTVLHNLVVNAIEAIEADDPRTRAIAITARRLDAGRLRFCVRDSGRGVVPEMRGRLFESFATSKPEGMGLGLTISRTLVEAHGGELELDNPRPTRFCFTLPIQP
jgi:two-component system sensor kinase FixL